MTRFGILEKQKLIGERMPSERDDLPVGLAANPLPYLLHLFMRFWHATAPRRLN